MPYWLYCRECGQQTPEHNSATRGRCDCGAGFWYLAMSSEELAELKASGLSVKEFAERARKQGRL